MSARWNKSQSNSSCIQKDQQTQCNNDLEATFHNEELKTLGCKHYPKSFKLKANCCQQWFTCRFCHDEFSHHEMPRKETKEMLCMVCQTSQSAGPECHNCHTKSGYFCSKCMFWSDEKKSFFHCEDCGMCRVGKGIGIDFTHCHKCGICLNIGFKHVCIERNLESDCPICGEYMFTSRQTVTLMVIINFLKVY